MAYNGKHLSKLDDLKALGPPARDGPLLAFQARFLRGLTSMTRWLLFWRGKADKGNYSGQFWHYQYLLQG